MISAIAYILTGVAICMGLSVLWDQFWSFRAQSPADYTAETPEFDLQQALSGRYVAHGAIFDYSGRANVRFTAEINGSFDSSGGVLSERFAYDGQSTPDSREWQIRFDGRRKFTATAVDVIGPALGEVSGNTIRMTYRLQLPERAGGHILNVVDWLYLMDDGTIINRSDMRKFGFKAAELFAVFNRPEGG